MGKASASEGCGGLSISVSISKSDIWDGIQRTLSLVTAVLAVRVCHVPPPTVYTGEPVTIFSGRLAGRLSPY